MRHKRDSDICECRCSTDHNEKRCDPFDAGTGKYQRTDREIGNYGSTRMLAVWAAEDK